MKVHHKYMKVEGDKAATFMECLERVQVAPETPSLLDYTTHWIKQSIEE